MHLVYIFFTQTTQLKYHTIKCFFLLTFNKSTSTGEMLVKYSMKTIQPSETVSFQHSNQQSELVRFKRAIRTLMYSDQLNRLKMINSFKY